MIRTEQIEQWLEEEKRATPGEWITTYNGANLLSVASDSQKKCICIPYEQDTPNDYDFNLIVTIRNNWRRVLEENLALKAEVEHLKKVCHEHASQHVEDSIHWLNQRDAWKQRAERLAEAIETLEAGLSFDGVSATPGSVNCIKALADYRASIEGDENV